MLTFSRFFYDILRIDLYTLKVHKRWMNNVEYVFEGRRDLLFSLNVQESEKDTFIWDGSFKVKM